MTNIVPSSPAAVTPTPSDTGAHLRHDGDLRVDINVGMPSLPKVRALAFLLVACLLATGAPSAWSQVATQYSYDAGDHITQVIDPRGLQTTYVYDGLDQKWQQTGPDTGTSSFTYDAYGRLSTMTRADGGQTTYGYDAVSRLTSVAAGGQTHTFSYDNCTNGAGRLCLVSDANGSTSYVYSPEGWVTGRGFLVSGTGYSLGYGYNAMGQLNAVVYPDGNSALYTYSNGAVSAVQVKIGSAVSNVATGITYQPKDLAMAHWTSGNALANTLSYDMDNRLNGISATGVQSLALTYDAANRATGLADGVDTDMSQSFGYDFMSRLISVYSNADNEGFQYDNNGNRTSQNNNGNAISFVITPGANQVTNRTAGTNINYGYDARGNLTTVSGVPYFSYDAFNRMTGANGSAYYVNPEGQRLRKTVGGVSTYFAPDMAGTLEAEYQSPSSWCDYVWLNGRLIARVNQGQILSIHADQLGRPEVMTDSSQAVVWRARNTAFDRTILINNSVPLNLTFPGQYYDAESNLSNNGFRDYSPLLGRYVESDPLGLTAGTNTYAYVLNNPLLDSDALGLQDSVKEQQRDNAVQGAASEASAMALTDAESAISDVGGPVLAGAGAISSVWQSLAKFDYNMFQQTGTHFYPDKFGDMDWSQYPSFAEAWKAYVKKRMDKNKAKKPCP